MATKSINTILNLKDNFSSGVSKATSSTKNFQRQIQMAQSSMGSMTNVVSKLKTGLGIFAGGFGLVKFTESAINAGDNMYKLSQKLHVSTAEASSLNKILNMTGTDSAPVIATFTKLDKAIEGAGTKGNATTEMLQKYGIALQDSSGKLLSIPDQLDKLAQGYQKASEAGQEEAFTAEVLGNKGAALIPLLENYAEAKEQAAKIKGIGVDPKQAHETAVELKVLKAQVGATAGVMAKSLIPVVQAILPVIIDVTQKITEAIKNNKAKIDGIIQTYLPVVKTALGIIKDVIGSTFNFIMNHGELIKSVIIGFGTAFVSINIATKVMGIIASVSKLRKAAEGLSGFAKAGKIFSDIFKLPPQALIIIAVITLIATGIYLLWNHSETFRNVVTNLWEKIKGFASWLGQVIPPILQSIGNWITTNLMPILQALGNWFVNTALPILKQFGTWIVANLMPVFVSLGNWFMTTALPMLQKVWNAITVLWNNVLVPLGTWLAGALMSIFQGIWTVISAIWNNVLVPLGTWIAGVFAPIFKIYFTYIYNVVSNVFTMIGGIINAAIEVIGGIADFISGVFTGNWSQAWEGIKEIFGGIWDGIGSVAKGILNGIIDGINAVIQGFNSFANVKLPDVLGGGTIGITIPEIPHFQTGTQYFSGGEALVGEHGPEIVKLPGGSGVKTAGETKKALGGRDIKVYVTIQGNVIGNEEYADSIGEHAANKILLALGNM